MFPDQLTPLIPLAAFGIAAVLYFALAAFNSWAATQDDDDDESDKN